MSESEFDPLSRLGQQVGLWRLDRLLGVGGMAAVYLGRGPDGDVAIKVLRPRLLHHPVVVARLEREYQVLSSVQHPNAVKVYEFGVLPTGEPFYVMEYLRGCVLNDVWKEHRGKVPVDQVFDWARQLLEVLVEYHNINILHRDIKPSNIWMCEDDTIRLLDFGIARVEGGGEGLTRDGTALGTPAFMAPEQARGKIHLVDMRSDLFSVGALLFALLSGRKIHEAKTAEETLILAATTPADTIARFMPDLDAKYTMVVDKALSWYPKNRYQTAQQMLRAVYAALDDDAKTNAWPAVQAQVHEVEEPASSERVATDSANPLAFGEIDFGVDSEASEFSDADPVEFHLQRCFRRVQQALDATRLYGWGHREVDRRLGNVFERFKDTLTEFPDQFEFTVRPDSLEANGVEVWCPDPPHNDVTFNMFASGFRHIRIKPSLTLEELEKFLHLLTLSPQVDLPPEDDLATALWDLDLASIETQLATIYQVSDDPEVQANFDEEIQRVRGSVAADVDAIAQLQVEQLSMLQTAGEAAVAEARVEATRTAFLERATLGALDSVFRSQFTQAQNRTDDFAARIIKVTGNAWKEAFGQHDTARIELPMAQILRSHLNSNLREVARYLHNMTRVIDDREAKRGFAESIFGDVNTQIAFEAARADPDLDDRVADFLGKFLAVGSATVMPDVVQHIHHTRSAARRAFRAYVTRNLDGYGAELAELLPLSDHGLAAFLFEVGRQSESDDALLLVGAACSHTDLELRRTAFEVLAQRFGQRAGPYVAILCRDEDESLRIRALRFGAENGFPELLDTLVEVAGQQRLHQLPFTERRLILETLFDLEPELAETTCTRIATGILTAAGAGKEGQTSRTIALRLLGERGRTDVGWDAIQVAGKWRPSNPKRVREAAKRATERWQARGLR